MSGYRLLFKIGARSNFFLLQVDQTEFPVHKCVLSSFSPYFKVGQSSRLLKFYNNVAGDVYSRPS